MEPKSEINIAKQIGEMCRVFVNVDSVEYIGMIYLYLNVSEMCFIPMNCSMVFVSSDGSTLISTTPERKVK